MDCIPYTFTVPALRTFGAVNQCCSRQTSPNSAGNAIRFTSAGEFAPHFDDASATAHALVARKHDMESYRCSDVPPKLYRVNYPGSRTTWTSQEGFRATDTSRTFGGKDLLDFKRSIEKSFTWSCRDPSPFISLFSDREHAENWGCTEPWLGNRRSEGGWTLCVIDTTELRTTTLFFKLSSLVKGLSLDIPERAQQHVEGAYLCLHCITPTAVVEERTMAQVEEGECRCTRFKKGV